MEMRSIENPEIKKIIIHILDKNSDEPLYSERELELDTPLCEFVSEHIIKGLYDEDNKKGIIAVMALTFVLGLTLSITELVCTGQIYVAIVNTVRYEEVSYAYFLLVSYNIMFVIPLIIIAVIAIRGKGVISTSNFIREHLHIIKILNALLFLIIAVYFYFRIF